MFSVVNLVWLDSIKIETDKLVSVK